MDYKKYSVDEIMLLGPKYNLIRDEFKNLPVRKNREKVEEIMVTTGGLDPHNMSVKLLNMILQDKELRNLNINVIVGNSFTNKEELRKISKENKNVILHENVKFMSKIMIKSDIAISSGGSTLYELCACGTPTLAFIYADNQEFIVKKMDELGYVISLGWYDAINNQQLLDKIKKIKNNVNIRQKYLLNQKLLVDGDGVKRIIKVLNDIDI